MRSAGFAALFFMGCVGFGAAARADTPSHEATMEAVDARTAHEAAVRLGCASDTLRRYYRRTLRDIDQRRWGVLRADMRRDTADLAGDAILDAATRANAAGDALAQLVGPSRPPEACTAEHLEAANRTLDRASPDAEPTELDKCGQKADAACTLARTARAALLGEVDAQRKLRDRGAPPRPSEAKEEAPSETAPLSSEALRPLLAAAESGAARELATRAAALWIPNDEPAPCSRHGTYARFLAALVAQMPDDGARSEGHDAFAAQQLRPAALEFVRCHAASGVERAATSEGPLGISLDWRPSPALRVSWNGAYKNATGDGWRILPSLDVLVARVRFTPRAANGYAGLQMSLVDLMAPFMELAFRRQDLVYDNEANLWLEVIKPRVELTVGAPAVTHRVLLSAGMSLRTVAPFNGGKIFDATKPAGNRATYITIWPSDPAGQDQRAIDGFSSFLEFSLGAKYVF